MEIISNAFNSGLNAVRVGQQRMDQAASEIARSAIAPQGEAQGSRAQALPPAQPGQAADRSSNQGLAESLVELKIAQIEVEAGTRVVDTADELIGTLVNTIA
jgi:hypothetical protein